MPEGGSTSDISWFRRFQPCGRIEQNGGAAIYENTPGLVIDGVEVRQGGIDFNSGEALPGINRGFTGYGTKPSNPDPGDVYLANPSDGEPTLELWTGSQWVDLSGRHCPVVWVQLRVRCHRALTAIEFASFESRGRAFDEWIPTRPSREDGGGGHAG